MGLDSVELVLEFEEIFDIEIPDSNAEAMRTVSDVQEFVETEFKRLGRPVNSQNIFIQIRDATAKISGSRPEKIGPGSRFVEDLDIN
jgi:acyl carrier protein